MNDRRTRTASRLAFALGLCCLLVGTATSGQRRSPRQPAKPTGAERQAAELKPPRDYPVKPVPFTAVRFTDSFWAPKIETNRSVTIPFAFRKGEETGR